MKPELSWALGVFAAVICTAVLVNALAPQRRTHLRRVVILFFVAVAVLGLHYALATLGARVWADRLLVAAELLLAFTSVNIVATLAFSVGLPRAGVNLPMIASDLLVAVAYIFATLGVLSGHGLNPSSILATSAVVSAVLAISLQSTLGNILGGVALQLDGSIREGDWVQLENGRQGRVRAVRWRHTVIETRDWATLIVPNAQLLASTIMILGKRESRAVPQRMWVWFNVDFRYPPTKVIQVVNDALSSSPIENVAADPKPNCVCMDFTKERRESMASYGARYHILDLTADDPTNSRVRARIFTALSRAGIPLAVPATTAFVEVHDEERTVKRTKRRFTERLEAIRTVHLFRPLQDTELETLAEGMSQVVYTAGEVITRQGARANWLYVMTKGTVEVRTTYDPDGDGPLPPETKVLSTLEAPDYFGEMGLMTGEPRQADVVAITDVECFRLEKATFERVLLERPEIVNELSDRLASQKVDLIAAREGLDAGSRLSRHTQERDKIIGGIKSFFGL
ncbi:MAG: mechanosensitive ion channel family protein [Labilithrix sp.]|nr:mechanosensitive ion channel family protein [Labilithrix sp.]